MPVMQYQLPNGKVVHLTTEEFLDLTDEDIQYLMSIDYGEHIRDPFTGSAISNNRKEKYYDFEFVPTDDEEVNNIVSDDIPFDDIIDLSENLDM
jgi:hypothetical protein